MQPCRLTRPKVGRRPVAPQARQGETMLPSVSLPIAKPTSPAAAADAEPADEPLEPLRGSHGLRVRPPNQRSPMASAPSDSLATSTAPASSSRAATVALPVDHPVLERRRAPGGRIARIGDQVLGPPGNAVQRTAIMARGDLPIGLRRLLEREVLGERHDALQQRVEPLEPLEIKLRQLGRADLPASDQGRQLDDRQERELFRRVGPADDAASRPASPGSA